MAEDLGLLQSSQDISQVYFSSHRRVVGNIIVFAKKALQQILTPILERQSAYNAANTRLIAALYERVSRLEEHVAAAFEALRAEETSSCETLRQAVAGQLEALAQQQAIALQALQMEVTSQCRQRLAQEQYLMWSLAEMRMRLSEALSHEGPRAFSGGEGGIGDAFFAAFDGPFRGSRADIKKRLRSYLPILSEAGVGTQDKPLVDLGCGRGEWLELLQEAGLQGKGVDQNRGMVEACRQHGFDVVESDSLAYLGGLPNGSLGGVTGFHLVEYLPFDILLKLFDETVRVLQPGGLAIFETANPQDVPGGTQESSIDPTRRSPLPSSLLRFIAEAKGLRRLRLLPAHRCPEAQKVQGAGLNAATRLDELSYGAEDYALIGWKV
jgi:O-antigen chain-terminating methyltransferase